jgi:hypothetical protein
MYYIKNKLSKNFHCVFFLWVTCNSLFFRLLDLDTIQNYTNENRKTRRKTTFFCKKTTFLRNNSFLTFITPITIYLFIIPPKCHKKHGYGEIHIIIFH